MSLENPFVSFIVPFYNVEEILLKRCLKSIIDLDIEDYEILVVDDGSSISPKNLIDSFNDNCIILFTQQNRGLGAARNTGLKHAKGTYIQFVDSDDYLLPSYNSIIDIAKNGKIDLINFRFYKTAEIGITSVINKQIKLLFADSTDYMINNNLNVEVWSYLFLKSKAENILFAEGILHEDEDFTPRLYLNLDKIIVTNIVAYAYYQRHLSITHNSNIEFVHRRFNDYLIILNSLKTVYNQVNSLRKKAIKRRIDQLSMDIIYKLIVDNISISFALSFLKKMKSLNQYPIPNKLYTYKYLIFRYLTLTTLQVIIVKYFYNKLNIR